MAKFNGRTSFRERIRGRWLVSRNLGGQIARCPAAPISISADRGLTEWAILSGLRKKAGYIGRSIRVTAISFGARLSDPEARSAAWSGGRRQTAKEFMLPSPMPI